MFDSVFIQKPLPKIIELSIAVMLREFYFDILILKKKNRIVGIIQVGNTGSHVIHGNIVPFFGFKFYEVSRFIKLLKN
jgi:hypothetical protein